MDYMMKEIPKMIATMPLDKDLGTLEILTHIYYTCIYISLRLSKIQIYLNIPFLITVKLIRSKRKPEFLLNEKDISGAAEGIVRLWSEYKYVLIFKVIFSNI